MIRIVLSCLLTFILLSSASFAGDDCASCHTAKNAPGFINRTAFQESAHGFFDCNNCHINISPYPHGKVARVNCGICHFLGRGGAPAKHAREFKLSVHNRITPVGKNIAPTCQTCHGSHYIYAAKDARSATRKDKIPALCAKCHPREAEQYGMSIHGNALFEHKNALAPTCFDCHLEHLTPPTGSEQWMLSLIKQCGNCHVEQMKGYRRTYHGKVTQLGYSAIATCADCHGSHTIARRADPASTLSEQNILATCSKCHPHATAGFTKYYAHADETNRAKYPIMYYTFLFMTTLLIGVFAFFFTHTFLWAYRSLKERMDRKGGE
jgi:hypothetical protein